MWDEINNTPPFKARPATSFSVFIYSSISLPRAHGTNLREYKRVSYNVSRISYGRKPATGSTNYTCVEDTRGRTRRKDNLVYVYAHTCLYRFYQTTSAVTRSVGDETSLSRRDESLNFLHFFHTLSYALPRSFWSRSSRRRVLSHSPPARNSLPRNIEFRGSQAIRRSTSKTDGIHTKFRVAVGSVCPETIFYSSDRIK